MHFFKKALPQKGSALLLVLSLSLAIGIISTALYQSYLQIEILAIKKNNSIELDLALESLVQYTKKGVSSLWCFDLSEWKDQLTLKVDENGQGSFVRKCSDLDEFLKHEGNVELLLADDKFKEKLRQLVAQKNAETESDDDNITTEVSSCLRASQCNDDEKWIEANIDPGSQFDNKNPIKPIMKKLASFSNKVKFKISRLGEKTHNLQGRRWVRISVSVFKSNKLIKELSVEYLMYPRQISSYAFLSANELRLNEDVRSVSSKKDGHTRISQIDKDEISQYKGLDVFSPVYVNTNIVLPNKSTKFSPVHFKAPVILGKGILKRDETDGIKAFSSIDETKFEKKYYTSVDGMSGFSGGIEIRGKKDDGLEKLSDASISVNYDTIYKCVGESEVASTYSEHQIFTTRDNGQYDDIENPMPDLTGAIATQERVRNHSKLMIKPLSQEHVNNELTLKYRLRLTPPNRFRSLPFDSKNGEGLTGINGISEEDSKKGILSVRLLSWKTGLGNLFSNSKQDLKTILSWKDSFSYSDGTKLSINTASSNGTTPTSFSRQNFFSINNWFYIGGGLKYNRDISNYESTAGLWRSKDGVSWTYLGEKFPLLASSLASAQTITKNNTVYLVESGYNTSPRIRKSSDGINWTDITPTNPSDIFTKRVNFSLLYKAPYMYVIGGKHSSGSHYNDVWRSEDGRKWIKHHTPYGNTFETDRYSATIKGDGIFFVGGNYGSCTSTSYADIWKYTISSNSWSKLSSTLTSRVNPRVFTKGNYIYAMGGTKAVPISGRDNCGHAAVRDGLWRSSNGSQWHLVDTENNIRGSEAPFVKPDGSVHFFTNYKSRFYFTKSLSVKTSPVKEQGFGDSYKNNEIDLSISIKAKSTQSSDNSPQSFTFTADTVYSSGAALVGYSNRITRGAIAQFLVKGTLTSGSVPSGFFTLYTNPYGNIILLGSKSFSEDVHFIKVRKSGDSNWKTYTFSSAHMVGWGDAYRKATRHEEIFVAGQSYQVQVITKQMFNAQSIESLTKNTKFVLDFLPYTLGSTDQATETEEDYWTDQHEDFKANTTGVSNRTHSLGKDDNDPSVFSALFKFEPQDFGASTDTYELSSANNEFTITTASTGSHSGTYGYTKRDLRELTGQKRITYAKGGSISGSFPSELLGINRHSGSPNVYMVLDTYPKFLSLKNKKLKITNITDNTDSIIVDLIVHNPNTPESKRKDNVDGYEFRLSKESFFQLNKQYKIEILGLTQNTHNPTGSLYHDLSGTISFPICSQRQPGKGDPKNDNNYIYKTSNRLMGAGGVDGKTDYSYTDWMTIGKSYYENTNRMGLCAYKSTEEDINGIQTTPCEENSTVNHNIFDEGLWEEDFLDYTKKSWNFFCSAANGDNTQVRRLSADKEVCTTGSANEFTITTASTGSHSGTYGYTKRDLRELTGQKRITYAKGGSISGSFPSELLGINRHSGSPNVYMVLDTYPKFLSLKNKKLKITNITDNTDSIIVDLIVHNPNTPESKRKDNVDGYEFRLSKESFFQLNKQYKIEIVGSSGDSLSTTSPRALSDKEYCAYCKPKETLCIGSGSNCDFTISNNLVSKKTNNSAPQFQNRGLYKKCVVNANADFVAGFFVCEEFYVASRTKALNIIGTVVSGKIDIHKQALKNGVSWMSIFHPKAVKLLQANGILYSSKFELLGENKEIGFTEDCNHLFDFKHRSDSIWSSKNHEIYKANAYTCSPASLTDNQESNPFSWTQVNPDCIMKREDGTTDSDSQILCKGRKKHFFMNEISRYLE